jgi:hypothetical protein
VIVPKHKQEVFRIFCSLPHRQAAEAMRDIMLGVTVIDAAQ